MKTKFDNFLNESLTDKMTGKSDEEVINKLKQLKASDKLMKIHRYQLSDDYLPSDEEWEEEMKDFVPQEKLDFIKRFSLPDKFRPSDEEIIEDLKNLNGIEQLNYIKHFNLSKDLIPDKDKIKTDVIKSVYKNYPNTRNKELSDIVNILFDNGYVYRGINIDQEGSWNKEDVKDIVIWFKYDNPEHYFSFTDKSNLSEVKDRINQYKKTYTKKPVEHVYIKKD